MREINQPFSRADSGFDPDELGRLYEEERDKRIRPDAEAQYLQISNDSPFFQ